MGYWTGICLRSILSIKILIKGEEKREDSRIYEKAREEAEERGG